MSKKSGQLNISITPEQEAFIAAMEEHRITGPEIIRGLIDAAKRFHDKNGWFSFPLEVNPVKFQLKKSTKLTERQPKPIEHK